MREIKQRYSDPLDLVWIHAAELLGITVQRDPEVFAAWDGSGILRIGTPETLDPDDCLAQMVFHEICHWLVEGPSAFDREDWGLVYGREEHEAHEHACLRLQAALADRYGLRQFLAATTDYRRYYDQLPEDPLTANGAFSDRAAELARGALARAESPPFGPVLDRALGQTRQIAQVLGNSTAAGSLWSAIKDDTI